MCTVEEDRQVTSERNRVIQCLLCRHEQRDQDNRIPCRRRDVPRLFQPPRSEGSMSNKSQLPSRSILESAKGLMHLNPINRANHLEDVSYQASHDEAGLPSLSGIEISRGLTRRDSFDGQPSAATTADKRITSHIRIQYLQEEVKRLKKKARR